MTSQLVIRPAQMVDLARVFGGTGTEVDDAELRLQAASAAVRLNAADPRLSPGAFIARSGSTMRAIGLFAQQTETESAQIDDARRQAELADGSGDGGGFNPVDFLIDFALGDIAAFWGRHEDQFALGPMVTGAIRVMRTGVYVQAVLKGAPPILPVFNTGLVGQSLAAGMQRVPGLAGAGSWLGSPAATTFFRRAGIVGAVAGTGIGMYDLYQQGNPIDAFEREGAGYVADVANTAFSASTAAFLIAPNPITGALVIGTGAVWLGAEIVDNWDTISETASEAWDSGTDWLADNAHHATRIVADPGGALVDGAGAIADGVGGLISDWF